MKDTVYSDKGWTSQGRGIYAATDSGQYGTLVAKVSIEVPEDEIPGVVELLTAAPETSRKLAKAESQSKILAALLAEYFEDFEDTTEARAKNATYPRRVATALRPMGYDLRNGFDDEAEQERAEMEVYLKNRKGVSLSSRNIIFFSCR